MNKLLVSMLIFSSAIEAQSPKIYVDISPVLMNYESQGISSEFKPIGFKWTTGYVVKEFSFASIAVDGSAMWGVKHNKKTTVQNSNGDTFGNATVSVDKMYSLHLKSMFPLSQSLNANLYLGGTGGKVLSSSDTSNSKSSFENSFSYGAGLEYWSSADASVYANYMQYFKNLNAIEIGVGFRF